MTLTEKFDLLKKYLAETGGVAIAFSGGVDSTFLLKTAHDTLGDCVIAVTARSSLFPERELNETVKFCRNENIRHFIVDSEEMELEGFSENPPNRCYICKKELFTKIRALAENQGIAYVAEGSNTDDDGDYRPGLIAVAELGVLSPLRYAGLAKDEIRVLSEKMGLPTWAKQSFACLASRFPYGETITAKSLDMIGKAEQTLLDMGFHQVRVRFHGGLARIETDEKGFKLLENRALREEIHRVFKQIGFSYIALDLLGYRMGSMNEGLALR